MPKLEYTNNWYADQYSINGHRVTKLTRVRIGEKQYDVETRQVSIPYNDMGHEYHGTSDHYFIKETVFGIRMEFDLNHIVSKRSIYPVRFEVE